MIIVEMKELSGFMMERWRKCVHSLFLIYFSAECSTRKKQSITPDFLRVQLAWQVFDNMVYGRGVV